MEKEIVKLYGYYYYSELERFEEVINGNMDPAYIPFKKAEDKNYEYIRIFQDWQKKVLDEVSKEKIIPVIDFYKKVYQEGVVQKANCSFLKKHIEKIDKNRYKELKLKLKQLKNLTFRIFKDKSVEKQILKLEDEIIEIEKLLFTDVLDWYSIKNEVQLPYEVRKAKSFSLLDFVFSEKNLDIKNIDTYILSKIRGRSGDSGEVFYRMRDYIKREQEYVRKRNVEYHENITKATEIKSSIVNEIEDVPETKVEPIFGTILSHTMGRSYYNETNNTYYIDRNCWDKSCDSNDNEEELKNRKR